MKYLIIESRDPFDSGDVPQLYAVAKSLRADGNDVTLFLVQNGVLAARPSKHSDALSAVAKTGVRSEEHTSELQSQSNLVCRLLLEKKKIKHDMRGEQHTRRLD